MKKIFSKLTILAVTGMAFLYSCKPADEVTPTSGKPTVTVEFDKANFGVQKDFEVSATVSTTGDTAFVVVAVNGTSSTGALYITYQKDNEKSVKFTKFPNGTSIPAAGYSGTRYDGTNSVKFNFVGGDYTFNIPNSHNKDFKFTFPVLLRKNETTAKSDVFQIWVTQNGKAGRFDNPAKNLAYGIATVKLNYTNEALINNYETELGSSLNTELGSLFSTSTGSNYSRRYVQDTLGVNNSVDFVYNNFTSGKFTFGSFYSSATATNADVTAGFGAVTNIKNVIKIKEVSVDFSTIVGDASLIAAVDNAAPTASFVTYTAEPTGKVLAFITASGKKGLIKVVSVNNANTATGSVNLEVKVQR